MIFSGTHAALLSTPDARPTDERCALRSPLFGGRYWARLEVYLGQTEAAPTAQGTQGGGALSGPRAQAAEQPIGQITAY